MTRFADETTTADVRVLRPRGCWDFSRREAVADAHRNDAGEVPSDRLQRRSKAPVETDHEHRAASTERLDARRDALELVARDAERLLDEHMLAGLERGDHRVGVEIVARGD